MNYDHCIIKKYYAENFKYLITTYLFIYISHSLFPHISAAPITLCRQCPGYVDATSSLGSSDFSCSTSTNHVLCLCCLQPMPDRRTDPDLSIPPQKCMLHHVLVMWLKFRHFAGDVCSKAYCHMYWRCRKYGCRGCLNLFKGMLIMSSGLHHLNKI